MLLFVHNQNVVIQNVEYKTDIIVSRTLSPTERPMDVKNGNHIWEVLGLIGVGAVILAILNPEFWQALYRMIIVVAAIAVVVGIGVGAAALFKTLTRMFRKPSVTQERPPEMRQEGETYTKSGDPRQVVYSMRQSREVSVYAPVTGIPVTQEEIKEMLAEYQKGYPDDEFPSMDQVVEYQKKFRADHWEPRLHELASFMAVRSQTLKR
jgi:hypothetical protein